MDVIASGPIFVIFRNNIFFFFFLNSRRNDGFITVTSDRDSSGAWTTKGASSNIWQRAGSGGMSSSNADRTALLSTVRQVSSCLFFIPTYKS